MTVRTMAVALALVSLTSLAALWGPPAAAQVHRWVDESGRVHYGDRPMGGTGTTLRIRAESATAPGTWPQGAPPAARPAAHPAAPAAQGLASRSARAGTAAGGAVSPGGPGHPGPDGTARSAASVQPAQAARPSTIEGLLAAQRPSAPAPMPHAHTPGMQALVAQCKANRGVDCDTPQGLRNLQRENTPITREEQARIAGLRARRATCARAPGAQGC